MKNRNSEKILVPCVFFFHGNRLVKVSVVVRFILSSINLSESYQNIFL